MQLQKRPDSDDVQAKNTYGKRYRKLKEENESLRVEINTTGNNVEVTEVHEKAIVESARKKKIIMRNLILRLYWGEM